MKTRSPGGPVFTVARTIGCIALLAGCQPEPTDARRDRLGGGEETGGAAGSTGGGGRGGAAGAKDAGEARGEAPADAAAASSVDAGTRGTDAVGSSGDAGDARASEAGAPDTGMPPAVPTFTELYTTIFGASQMASASSCWGAPCHNPGKMDGVNLATRMTAYTTLRPMVTPGTPATSKLVRSLESTTAGKRMPLGRKALDAVMIAKVKAWIVAGAMND